MMSDKPASGASELADLRAEVEKLTKERDEAVVQRNIWFEVHDAHRKANIAMGEANGKFFHRVIGAERRAEAAEAKDGGGNG